MGTIFLGIAMFMFLVLIHEIGHFIAARRAKVKVEEFGIGIPPKVTTLGSDAHGTEFTINWIPLGGFVRLKGENPDDTTVFLAPDSFICASFRNKILILIAGVTVNAIFAWIAFVLVFWHGVYPLMIVPDSAMRTHSTSYLMPTYSFLEKQGLVDKQTEGPVVIQTVQDDSLGDTIGLEEGDEIVTIDGKDVSISSISSLLQQAIGSSVTIEIRRGDEVLPLTLPCGEESCFLGVGLDSNHYDPPLLQYPLGQAMGLAFHEIGAQTRLTFVALGGLFRSLVSFDREKISTSINKLSGPVGIVKFGEYVREDGGRVSYLAFAGMISLALAVFNILPIPALDGGRVVGVIIQTLGRLKAEMYYTIENYINIFFFVLLMGLGIYIILLDLVRLRGVKIPFFS